MHATLAIFGLKDGLNTAVNLLLFFAVILWLALIFYTYTDARRRINDHVLALTLTVGAIIVPFVGTIIYMVVRPPEYLDDVRERELEMQAAEARLHQSGVQLCPSCQYQVKSDYLRCPSCLTKLRDQCVTCAKPLDPDWRICPFCESEIAGKTPRRRRSPGDESASGSRSGRGDGSAPRSSARRSNGRSSIRAGAEQDDSGSSSRPRSGATE